MLMRYLCLAILATTAATAFSQSAPESADNNSNALTRKLVGDFDWDGHSQHSPWNSLATYTVLAIYHKQTIKHVNVNVTRQRLIQYLPGYAYCK
jgi:hypothetical protein